MIISSSILFTTACRAIFQCSARGAVFCDTLHPRCSDINHAMLADCRAFCELITDIWGSLSKWRDRSDRRSTTSTTSKHNCFEVVEATVAEFN